jgi:RNA polymerase sigma-70 factor (sigma-E family)
MAMAMAMAGVSGADATDPVIDASGSARPPSPKGRGMRFDDFAAERLPALLNYAVLLTGDRESARDLVQEVLTRALIKWDRIEAVDQPYAYVRRMLTNEHLSWRRRRRVPTVPLRDEPGPSVDPPPPPDDEMWRLLAGLPRQQRAVLVLRYYEGLTDREIAGVLGCRPVTVRSNASRALAALRIEIAARTIEGAQP